MRHNLRVVARYAGAARVWAVLKADAYGHGAPAVARTLERVQGLAGFCVALLEEAIELREAGIVAPILVMGGHYGSAHDEVIARDLVPVVHDAEHLGAFARLVRSGAATGPIDVHLKIDTGMGRLGVTMDALPALAASLAGLTFRMRRGKGERLTSRVPGLVITCGLRPPALRQGRAIRTIGSRRACHIGPVRLFPRVGFYDVLRRRHVDGVVQPAPAPRFSRTPSTVSRPPSPPGADTITGLADWGVDEGTIAKLQESGALS